jgi:hypothetical protein
MGEMDSSRSEASTTQTNRHFASVRNNRLTGRVAGFDSASRNRQSTLWHNETNACYAATGYRHHSLGAVLKRLEGDYLSRPRYQSECTVS